jgi:alpha-beta hydrolase superfamily lysophospholipase
MASFKLKEPPPRVIEGVEVPLDSTGRPLTAKAFNKPDSGLYFYNDRLQRIHVRRWLPASVAEAKGIVFQFHGYADHCNNSNKEELAAALTSAGFAVFMFDAHGHGYSEGDRVYVAKWQHLIDDAILFVNLILAGAVTGHRDVKFDVDVIVWGEFLKSAPFAFMGQSLGGAVTVLSSTM